jgi:enterochelin esterase-like enzyme
MPFCKQHLRYSILILAVAFASLVEANAQSKVVEGLSFTSKTDHKINYAIYLPSDYEESMRSYPVLYLFHGLGNDESAWIQFGNMKSLMDSMYADHSITPMIVVMPYGGKSWFIDVL